MAENKLADLSTDFAVSIINLFKDLGSRCVTVILNRIGLFINEKPPAFQNTGGIIHVSTGPCVFQFISL